MTINSNINENIRRGLLTPCKESQLEFINIIKQGYTIRDIASWLQCPCYRIIDVLWSDRVELSEIDKLYIYKVILNYHYTKYINQDRCVIISDNHMGRIVDPYNKDIDNNERTLYESYEYAEKNNINNIINCGDIIEGFVDDRIDNTKINRLDEQLDYLEKNYPKHSSYPDIKTFILLGNHDYFTMYNRNRIPGGNNCETIENLLLNRQNTELIGIKDAYINFNGEFLKLHHDCTCTNFIKDIDINTQLTLCGHKHRFIVDDNNRKIFVPTTAIPKQDEMQGFLELRDEGNLYRIIRLNENSRQISEHIINKKRGI